MNDNHMMPDRKRAIDRAEHVFYKTYNRYPVIFDHGDGVYLYDSEGKEYLDFGAGIAVMGLGYNDPEYNLELAEQLNKLLHRQESCCTRLTCFTISRPSTQGRSF